MILSFSFAVAPVGPASPPEAGGAGCTGRVQAMQVVQVVQVQSGGCQGSRPQANGCQSGYAARSVTRMRTVTTFVPARPVAVVVAPVVTVAPIGMLAQIPSAAPVFPVKPQETPRSMTPVVAPLPLPMAGPGPTTFVRTAVVANFLGATSARVSMLRRPILGGCPNGQCNR